MAHLHVHTKVKKSAFETDYSNSATLYLSDLERQ